MTWASFKFCCYDLIFSPLLFLIGIVPINLLTFHILRISRRALLTFKTSWITEQSITCSRITLCFPAKPNRALLSSNRQTLTVLFLKPVRQSSFYFVTKLYFQNCETAACFPAELQDRGRNNVEKFSCWNSLHAVKLNLLKFCLRTSTKNCQVQHSFWVFGFNPYKVSVRWLKKTKQKQKPKEVPFRAQKRKKIVNTRGNMLCSDRSEFKQRQVNTRYGKDAFFRKILNHHL